jgi:hypothetical protein
VVGIYQWLERNQFERTDILCGWAVNLISQGDTLPARPVASEELIAALGRATYAFRGDRLLLEPKDQVKARLGYRRTMPCSRSPRAASGGAQWYYDRTEEWEAMRHSSRPGRGVLTEYDVLKGS